MQPTDYNTHFTVEFPFEFQLPSGTTRRMLINCSVTYDFDPDYGADADGNRGLPMVFGPTVELLGAFVEIHKQSVTHFRQTTLGLFELDEVYYVECRGLDDFFLPKQWEWIKEAAIQEAEVEMLDPKGAVDDREGEI